MILSTKNKQKVLLSIIYIIINITLAQSQNNIVLGTSRLTLNQNDNFTYKGNIVGNYALQWAPDNWHNGGHSLFLTGWGGIKFFTGGVFRFGINSVGNVGIGTESAQYKLDINGNAGIANNLYLGKQISTSEGGEVVRLSIVPYRHTGGKWDFVSRDTPNEAFMDIKYANFNAATFYYFNGQTRVGIGVTNPKYKLDVAGVIRAEEVKIEAQPWADFVFDKDYKLPSLDEVKAHIDEHKHLPNIPSEKEVQENGIGLGEMQAKLLQKIEELTLYVIQQNKTIEKQEQRILELEKKK